jgi:zinc transport system substrate-binding protein
LLLDRGRSPHAFVLKPSSARLIQKADLIIRIGAGLETALASSLDKLAGEKRLLTLSQAHLPTILPIRPGGLTGGDKAQAEHRLMDPHIWLDPDNAVAMAVTIAERLKQVDPDNRSRYESNTRTLLKQIRQTDEKLTERLASHTGERYLSLHDSFRYFEQHYGLVSAGSLGADTHHGAGAKRIAALRQALAEQGIACVIHEPLSPRELLEVLLEGRDTPAVVADPLGWQPEGAGRDYPSMLEAVADSFEACFTGGESPI